MSKFTNGEKSLVKNIIASLTIKRIDGQRYYQSHIRSDRQVHNRKEISNIRERIKRESYHWYKTMREGEYEYIHEFKERINEILFLQKKHHQIVMRNEDNPQIQQTSLAELHRLSITLSNLYDVAPTIIGVGTNATISITPETKRSTTARMTSSSNLSVLKGLPFWIWDKEQHRQQAAATNGNCCFQHVVGLPTKDKREYPLFDYEKLLYDSLMSDDGSFKDKHLWVKKATGLGVTEFMLRMMAWLCTRRELIEGIVRCA